MGWRSSYVSNPVPAMALVSQLLACSPKSDGTVEKSTSAASADASTPPSMTASATSNVGAPAALPPRPGPVARCSAGARPEAHAVALGSDEVKIDGRADDVAWLRAPPVSWNTDFARKKTAIDTRARFLWEKNALYVLFELEGAGLAVRNTDHAKPAGVETENLYEEDCVELFLTPDPSAPDHYFEIELSPFGRWFDLDVHRKKKPDIAWSSAPTIAAVEDGKLHTAVIEARFEAADIAKALEARALPLGLFRIEGRAPRTYLAWSPARTTRPDFHVPEAFGTLCLDR